MSKQATPKQEVTTMNTQPTLFDVTPDTSLVVQKILSEAPEEFTLYQLAKWTNRVLQEVGSEKVVRSQMMYNYGKNGMIVKGNKEIKSVTRDQAIEFITRYANRNM